MNDNKQSREEMCRNIQAASNKKILRRQMELLAEYSRLPSGNDKIPECSMVLLEIYRELSKTKRIAFFVIALLGTLFSLLYSVNVKLVKLFKRK